MLTVWNWKPSPWISKTAATPLGKEMQNFQFIFIGQQYELIKDYELNKKAPEVRDTSGAEGLRYYERM